MGRTLRQYQGLVRRRKFLRHSSGTTFKIFAALTMAHNRAIYLRRHRTKPSVCSIPHHFSSFIRLSCEPETPRACSSTGASIQQKFAPCFLNAHDAYPISIFNTKNILPVRGASKQIVYKRCSKAAKMQRPRR